VLDNLGAEGRYLAATIWLILGMVFAAWLTGAIAFAR